MVYIFFYTTFPQIITKKWLEETELLALHKRFVNILGAIEPEVSKI